MSRNAVIAAQALLAQVDQNLVVDGRLGQHTRAVFERAPTALKLQINSVVKAFGGTTFEKLTMSKPTTESSGEIPENVKQAIDTAADELQVPKRLLYTFAFMESRFRPDAQNGQSRGLFQIQPAAWSDVSKLVNLPAYKTAVFDPLWNSRAAAGYVKVLQKQLRALGYTEPFSPGVLYVAHQQGAGGFMDLYMTSKGTPLKRSYVSSRAMEGNPPQDGKGKTLDKSEFLQRWLAVVEQVSTRFD